MPVMFFSLRANAPSGSLLKRADGIGFAVAVIHTKKGGTVAEKISNRVSVFERSVGKAQEWISELHEYIPWVSGDAVYHLFRAVLQTLRDQLSIDEAAHFAAQLPLLLRGTFYECWDPQSLVPKGLGKDEFLDAVKLKMGPVSDTPYDYEKGVLACLLFLKRHISEGEMDDVISALKPTLRGFIMSGEIDAQTHNQ